MAQDSFNNLKNFRSEQKLKQAALVYMVAHFTSKEEEAKLRESFQQFDTDKSGKIELEEFIKAYQKSYPKSSAEFVKEEATKIFKMADIDGNGHVDYEEW